MFKTSPFVSEKAWGYENRVISTSAREESTVLTGDERYEGKPLSAAVGEDFPLVVKIIQADEKLPAQDSAGGKAVCRYVLGAASEALAENVEKGDFMFVPAGAERSVCGGVRLLEVQEVGDGTPCTSGEPEVIKNFDDVFTCEAFTVEKGSAIGSVEITSDVGFLACTSLVGGKKPDTPAVKHGWAALFILEGTGTLTSSECTSLSVKAEDTIMFKADEQLMLTPVPGRRIRYLKIM